MKVLHLNLYRKYFDAILKGDKVVEYRDITPYWSKRLEGRHYDIIQFRNGYAKVAPTMKVEYKGIHTFVFYLHSWSYFSISVSKLNDIIMSTF